MRVIVIILALIGGLVVLTIGGCVGCMALVVANSASSTPAHFTRAEIGRVHAQTIEAVRVALAPGQPAAGSPSLSFDPALVAIFRIDERPGEFHDDYVEIYQRHAVTKYSHTLWNGAGSVGLTVDGLDGDYAGYQLDLGPNSYLLCFQDWQPEPQPAAAAAP